MMKTQIFVPRPGLAVSFYPFNPSLDDEIKRLFALNLTVGPVNFNGPDPTDVREEFRRNGRDSEYCPELESGIVPTPNPSRKKLKKPLPVDCAFCKNNGELSSWYRSHLLKDVEGRVTCPILREYRCPICGAFGDTAHTIKYCPTNKNLDIEDIANSVKTGRNSVGKRRSNQIGNITKRRGQGARNNVEMSRGCDYVVLARKD